MFNMREKAATLKKTSPWLGMMAGMSMLPWLLFRYMKAKSSLTLEKNATIHYTVIKKQLRREIRVTDSSVLTEDAIAGEFTNEHEAQLFYEALLEGALHQPMRSRSHTPTPAPKIPTCKWCGGHIESEPSTDDGFWHQRCIKKIAAEYQPGAEPQERIETGVLEFANDWPGLFLRGDNATGYAAHLKAVLENTRASALSIEETRKLLGLLDRPTDPEEPTVKISEWKLKP